MLQINEADGTVTETKDGEERTFALASKEGFALVSRAWLRAGWDAKHVYTFTWMGRPLIQLPEDMLRLQEVIFALKPDLIVETGVAHGGSLVFHASLMELAGNGHVIGVDIEIRAPNRAALESHPLAHRISLVEGDSIAPATVQKVHSLVEEKKPKRTLVILDSRHTKDHVRRELELYGPLVSQGSYIIACDGIMAEVVGAPRTSPDWAHDHPKAAVAEFLSENNEFERARPDFAFDESGMCEPITYWPEGWLRRL